MASTVCTGCFGMVHHHPDMPAPELCSPCRAQGKVPYLAPAVEKFTLPGEPKIGERKPTNPKDACGIAKVPFSTVPARVVGEIGLAMLEGALKYGRHNYRVTGVRASVYYDAAQRHLTSWWEGQDNDPDSGLSHVVKALACLTVLRDAMTQDMLTDDRPPVSLGDWTAELNTAAKKLLERYPNPKPALTQKP